jgi:hypothetical protein
MTSPHVPAHLWGRSLEFLFYDEVERVACVSKFFKLQVFLTVLRVNFRTIESLVREVEVVRHFHQHSVSEVFLSDFFSMAPVVNTGFASFALPPKYCAGSTVISSICAYQHVLALGMPNKVVLGHSWDYVIQFNEEAGVDVLVPLRRSLSGQCGPNDPE